MQRPRSERVKMTICVHSGNSGFRDGHHICISSDLRLASKWTCSHATYSYKSSSEYDMLEGKKNVKCLVLEMRKDE